MNRKDRKEFIQSVCRKIKELNNIDLLRDFYNGYNFDGILFDFEHENYIFTISTDTTGKIYLVENVDVWNNHDSYYGNYDFELKNYLK